MKCCQLAEVVILPAAQASVGRLGLHTLVFGEGAFRECTSLRCMNIPSHPVKVLDNTFWGCTKLTEVSSYQTHCVNSRDIYSTIVNHWHTSTFLPLYKRLEADRSWGWRICPRYHSPIPSIAYITWALRIASFQPFGCHHSRLPMRI